MASRRQPPPFLSQLLLLQMTNLKKEEVDPGVVEGTNLRIVKYPHPALRAPNQEITLEQLKEEQDQEGEESSDTTTSRLSIPELAKQMLKIMYAAEGVGLAAPQVGINQRLMVYNPTGDSQKGWLQETVLINPRIVEYSEAKCVETEGCLSFPDMNGEVERSKWIKVEAMNLKGKTIKVSKWNGMEWNDGVVMGFDSIISQSYFLLDS